MILLVDDDVRSRRLMAEAVAGGGYLTVEAGGAEEALEVAARERPGLAVIEVLLPMTSGYEVCRVLKERYGPGFPVIFVSGRRKLSADRVAGLLTGADDYVVKPIPPGELLARVRRLLPLPAALTVAPAGRLTPREREVMTLLADGLSAPEIADRLVITPGTVEKHIEHILAKLGVHSRAQAVAVALRGQMLGEWPEAPAEPGHRTSN
jgi:DNA-binding NarL/FixJ family response regulator